MLFVQCYQAGRKSALLTAAKRARLKKNPSRVRFADVIVQNGNHVVSVSRHYDFWVMVIFPDTSDRHNVMAIVFELYSEVRKTATDDPDSKLIGMFFYLDS